MQVDFHHGVTYVLARLAGFGPGDASIIAASSQYVDDAVESGAVTFDNGAMYKRISSAHKMLDYRNCEELASHLVWVPFHFLPGNGGCPAGQDPDGTFIRKVVCVPNSPVAQDVLRWSIAQGRLPYGLYRLGITMHVYADTWAHQGFAGVNHVINHATDLAGPDGKPDDSLADKLKNYFLNTALPLGHGAVLSNPDKPFLVWSYTNGLGERVQRDNPRDYLEACDCMVRAMQRFRAGDDQAPAAGPRNADRDMLDRLLRTITHPDGTDRHVAWLSAIEQGAFSFGPEKVSYVGEGEGSWKHQALGEASGGKYAYRPEFLGSHWKRFHDALQAHRFDVLHHILPAYGICAA
jgi:hypothetical protein